MAILGSIIKTTINTIDTLNFDSKTALEHQKIQLNNLLYKAKDTSFGKYYNFTNLLESKDVMKEYKKRIPIFDYNTINQKWWKQQQIQPDITWPGHPDYFAKSSGTTGKKSKRIPITSDYITSVRSVGTSMIKDLSKFDLPSPVFEKEIFMLSSSAKLKTHKNGFEEGEISGINVSNFPDWYDVFYRPGKKIAAIEDWDERKEQIAIEAPNWDIGAVAGIPSWILEILKAIIKKNNLNNIHEIWPNFTIYSSGGVAFETYRSSFEKVCDKEITVLDTYLASEGFFAYTARPNTMSMKLALHHNMFFEFVPFNKEGFDETGNILKEPKVLHIHEVEENTQYALLVTTSAGAWRYMVGDTIEFTDLKRHEIKITGRTKFFLNVVGSQLSEEKLDKAVLDTAKKFNIDINEYTVGAIKEGEDYYHQWILVSDDKTDNEACKDYIDGSLQEANKNYKVARKKALKGIKLKVITKKSYHNYLKSENKNGGQIKTPKVMTEEKIKKYLAFLK